MSSLATNGPERDEQAKRMEALLEDCKSLLQDIKTNTSA